GVTGFVFAQFRATDFFAPLVRSIVELQDFISGSIYDGVDQRPENLLFRWDGGKGGAVAGSDLLPIAVAGRTWMLHLRIAPSIVAPFTRALPSLVAIVGLLMSLFVYLLTRLLQRGSERLRLQEAQLRLVTDRLPMCVAYVDPDFRYRFLNRPFEA